jgi:hypothetical protein
MSQEKYIGMDVHLATTISVARADSSIVAQPTDTSAVHLSLSQPFNPIQTLVLPRLL